jgi:hemerythrin-like domain-containing protein
VPSRSQAQRLRRQPIVDLAEQLGNQLRRHVAFEDAVFARLHENLPREDREQLGSRVVRPADREGTERDDT